LIAGRGREEEEKERMRRFSCAFKPPRLKNFKKKTKMREKK
jgi:hypothetical protein